jgi:hypothetical protein
VKEYYNNLLQNRISELAVNSSAMRNQGAKGIIKICRDFFKDLDLHKFVVDSEQKFISQLNLKTNSLVKKLPLGAQNWGTARKALNLFLRDVLYNYYLRNYYKFNKIEKYLEVPLDSFVSTGIKQNSVNPELPKWPGIIHLKPDDSMIFQNRAKEIAKKENVSRVHLDLKYWRNTETKKNIHK